MPTDDDKTSVQNTLVGHSSDLSIRSQKVKNKKTTSVNAENQGTAKVGRCNSTEHRTPMLSPHLPDPESAFPLKITVTWVKKLALQFGLQSSQSWKTLIRQHVATLAIWDVTRQPDNHGISETFEFKKSSL